MGGGKTRRSSCLPFILLMTKRMLFAWLLTGFGKSIEYKCLPFLFHHKLNRLDGRTSSIVLVVYQSLYTREVGGSSKTTLFLQLIRGHPREQHMSI